MNEKRRLLVKFSNHREHFVKHEQNLSQQLLVSPLAGSSTNNSDWCDSACSFCCSLEVASNDLGDEVDDVIDAPLS